MSLLSALREAVRGQSAPSGKKVPAPSKRPEVVRVLNAIRDSYENDRVTDHLRAMDSAISELEIDRLKIDLSAAFEGLPESLAYLDHRKAMEDLLTSFVPMPVAGTSLFMNAPAIGQSLLYGFIQTKNGTYLQIHNSVLHEGLVVQDFGTRKVYRDGLSLLSNDSVRHYDDETRFNRLWNEAEKVTGRPVMMPKDPNGMIAEIKAAYQASLGHAAAIAQYGVTSREEMLRNLPADLNILAGLDLDTIHDRVRLGAVIDAVGPALEKAPNGLDMPAKALWDHFAKEASTRIHAHLQSVPDVDQAAAALRGDDWITKLNQTLRWIKSDRGSHDAPIREPMETVPDNALLSAYGATVPKNPVGFAPWIDEANEIAAANISRCDKLIRTEISKRHKETELGARLRRTLFTFGRMDRDTLSDSLISRMIDDIASKPQLAEFVLEPDAVGLHYFLGAQIASERKTGRRSEKFEQLLALTDDQMDQFAEIARWAHHDKNVVKFMEDRLGRGSPVMPEYFRTCLKLMPRCGDYAVRHLIAFGMALERDGKSGIAETLESYASDLSQRSIIHITTSLMHSFGQDGPSIEDRLAKINIDLEPERDLMRRLHIGNEDTQIRRHIEGFLVLMQTSGGHGEGWFESLIDAQHGYDAETYEHLLKETHRIHRAGSMPMAEAVTTLMSQLNSLDVEYTPAP